MKYLKKELNHELSSVLLPKNFTLPQLQKLYEDILGKKIDKRNFRKQLLKEGSIVKTKHTTNTGKKGSQLHFISLMITLKNMLRLKELVHNISIFNKP